MTDLAQRLEPIETQLAAMYFTFFVIGCAVLLHVYRGYRARIAVEWPDAVRVIADRPWRWTDPALILLPTLLLSSAYTWFAHSQLEAGRFGAISVALILTHAPIILATVAVILFRRTTPRAAFGIGSENFIRHITYGQALYFAMSSLVLPAMIVASTIMTLFGHEPAPQQIVNIFAQQKEIGARIFYASWTVLVAPIAEEIFFRGLLLPVLIRKVSPLIATLIVSVVFALLHGDATAFFPLFVVSTCLCLSYIVTRSLTVTITMHALFNSVTTLVLLLTG